MIVEKHKIRHDQPVIKQLDETAINRIAAGEVVERPSSAVKELIENSIDAGAKSVSIDIADGGKTLIRVIDDGCGMTPTDLPLAVSRHATSKLSSDDLFDISRINKAGAVFDTVKLTWMNKQYLAKKSDHEILALIHSFVDPKLKKLSDLDRKILSVRDNIETLSQINDYLDVYSRDTTDFFNKFQALPITESDIKVIEYAHAAIAQLSKWDASSVTELMEGAIESLSLGKGKVMKPMRKSMTGDESGPNLIDCLALIPLNEIKARLELVLKHVNSTASN